MSIFRTHRGNYVNSLAFLLYPSTHVEYKYVDIYSASKVKLMCKGLNYMYCFSVETVTAQDIESKITFNYCCRHGQIYLRYRFGKNQVINNVTEKYGKENKWSPLYK